MLHLRTICCEYNHRRSDVVFGGDCVTNTQAWDYAIGIIKVDGLEPTADFKKYIEKEKKGEISMDDVKRYLDNKYKVKQ